MQVLDCLRSTDILDIALKQKKNQNKNFSIRSWARQLGLKSHGPLQQILTGKRSVPKKYIEDLSESIGLNSLEKKYFKILLNYENAKNLKDKSDFFNHLNKINPNGFDMSFAQFEFNSINENNNHFILLKLIKNFQSGVDAKCISMKLNVAISEKEVKACLQRLVDFNYLNYKDKLYFFNKDLEKVLSFKNDIELKRAHQSCDKGAIEKYSSICIDSQNIEKMNEEIVAQVTSILEKYKSNDATLSAVVGVGLGFVQYFKI